MSAAPGGGAVREELLFELELLLRGAHLRAASFDKAAAEALRDRSLAR